MGRDDFVAWIEDEIRSRYWTYNELGRQAGLSSATISSVMTGRRNPGVDFCKGIAKAFGVSVISVLEKADIIPPLDDEDLSFRELWHHVRKLPYRDRVRLIQIASQWSRETEETEEKEE